MELPNNSTIHNPATVFSVIYRTVVTLSSQPHHREVLLPREDNQRERITLSYGNFYCCTVHFDSTEILITNKCTSLLYI